MIQTGLGDKVQTVIEWSGLKNLHDIFFHLAGLKNNCKENPVGSPCQQRQEMLNKMFPTRGHFARVQFVKDYTFVPADKPSTLYKCGQIEEVSQVHPLYHQLFFLAGAQIIKEVE